MTKAEIFDSNCGQSAVVEVTSLNRKEVRVVIHSECDQITRMNSDLEKLQWKGKGHQVFTPINESAVYQSAINHLRHSACSIPAMIIRAIEVEVGISLPKDITITFDHSVNDKENKQT